MMATMYVCDQCGKTEKEGHVLSWVVLDLEMPLTRIGEPQPPYHLCSWACAAQFAAQRQPKQQIPYSTPPEPDTRTASERAQDEHAAYGYDYGSWPGRP